MKPSPLPTVDVRSCPCEVRMSGAPGKRKIEGYAAVFNSRSEPLMTEGGSRFIETIRPGAFAKSLTGSDVRGLFNHDSRYVLGRQGAGTLRLSEDSNGLAYEIDLGTRSYDRDLEESLDRKDIIGSSFAFATVDDDWDFDEAGDVAIRELRAVHIFDVGPVVFPAYRAATSTVRSHGQFVESRSAKPVIVPAIVYPTPEQLKLVSWFKFADL